jgi:hypothetical protein
VCCHVTGPKDVCQTEVFEASCADDELIAMATAYYGRMRLGRCVLTDYGHVGCQADVIAMADRQCSGRRWCQIRVPDAAFDLTRPCPVEFKTYLEASYLCLPGKVIFCYTCVYLVMLQCRYLCISHKLCVPGNRLLVNIR